MWCLNVQAQRVKGLRPPNADGQGEGSFSEAAGRTLIAGDFNSKLHTWGKSQLERKGVLFGEMVAGNKLLLLNRGGELTFRREARGSIINLKFSTPRLDKTKD